MAPVGRREDTLLNPPIDYSPIDCEQQIPEHIFNFTMPDLSTCKVPDLVLALGDSNWSCPTSPLAPSSCIRQIAATEGYKPIIFNKLLEYALEGVRRKGQEYHSLESDALFRTILWSHSDPEQRHLAHPLWEALRAMDEYTFKEWHSKAQRIAAVFLCSQLLKVS